MKKLSYLLVLLFTHCFTVYTQNESILESEKINSKTQIEKKDLYVLTHTLTNDGLYLLLDAYQVEEENQVHFIKEKYEENKGVKLKTIFDDGIGGCDVQLCGAILVVTTTIFLLEIPTLPFRMMSEPKERIRKEIKTMKSNKIGVLSTENIYFSFLEKNSSFKNYPFEEDKVLIPISELGLNSFNIKNFSYKLTFTSNGKKLREGNLDLSNDVKKSKELQAIVKENDSKNPAVQCKISFPILEKQDLEKNIAEKDCTETCKRKFSKPNVLVWNNDEYNACLKSIENCYSITRIKK
ncbi:MAG TPA: hypothetical protein PK079_22085 [Leptospiraceae bacterium]|nr:hypothetical protein [Leptospiraceae bacterium]HMW07498.1 hypothetical protein [Leptospiraceae bacterium]HMX33112.1 hypothetical protein [Leptospiraceae bacterium]HMY33108.1 hypothetical protein [Leptospiraceae bacterium]HMZ64233.1 hypothetical protein [Leptospiraceae bacterium]